MAEKKPKKINTEYEDNDRNSDTRLPLFREETPVVSLDDANEDIASQFLFDTLIKSPRLWEVFNTQFVTSHTWRVPVKAYQIKALRTLKKSLPDHFIQKVATSLAFTHEAIFGPAHAKVVTPVPCGNSNRIDCLSAKLAESLAINLDLPFATVLSAPLSTKSSHPQVSRHWRAPKVAKNVRGRFLVVDDVCTTGRHMALSLNALRNTGCEATGIAWIGQR